MLSLLVALFSVGDSQLRLLSPDGHLAIALTSGALRYEVALDGQTVLAPSRMGLEYADGSTVGDHATVIKVEKRTHSGAWTDSFGRQSRVKDRWNELTLGLRDQGREFRLIVRAYDDGIAFRYALPDGAFTLRADKTEFCFPDDAPAWGGEYSGSTEIQYPETMLSRLPAGRADLPIVVRAKPAFVAIAEADLRDWAGMFLGRASGTTLHAILDSPVVGSGPRTSPWRVAMIGKTAADLVASNLIKNLAEPSRLDASWVHPGIAAWDPWWTGENPSLPQYRGLYARGDTTAHKRYIDFAAEMGWAYQIVDWFWYDMDSPDPETAAKPQPTVDVAELVRYANSKGVKLLLWVHSKDVTRMGADRLFATYARWGVAGVKVDFMNSDSQETVRWYEETLAAAARHHLIVNFHGAYKPTGLARTYPNYITQEGVLGNEYNKLSGELFTPHHMITLPFTRGLLGPADVTPGGFINRSPAEFRTGTVPTQVMGSRTRQLALTVLMDSPLTCLCDAPENYWNQPGVEFYRGLPTVWDETRALRADFAKELVLARRKGRDWWLGGMNDNVATSFDLPLDFLGRGSFRLETFEDGESLSQVVGRTQIVTAKDRIHVRMSPAGGFTARLRPVAP